MRGLLVYRLYQPVVVLRTRIYDGFESLGKFFLLILWWKELAREQLGTCRPIVWVVAEHLFDKNPLVAVLCKVFRKFEFSNIPENNLIFDEKVTKYRSFHSRAKAIHHLEKANSDRIHINFCRVCSTVERFRGSVHRCSDFRCQRVTRACTLNTSKG